MRIHPILIALLVLAPVPLSAAPTPTDTFTPTPALPAPGTYRLRIVHSNKYVTMDGGAVDGANIYQDSANGSDRQLWTVSEVSPGWHSLQSVNNNGAADVQGAGSGDGDNIYTWHRTDTSNQLWAFTEPVGGAWHIKAQHSGKYWDVWAISTDDGANIYQWSGPGGGNQLFVFEAFVATPTPTASPTPSPTVSHTPIPCYYWDLASEHRLSPGQENPNRDACGNLGVWTYMGATTVHDPSSYYTAATFSTGLGTEAWHGAEWQGGYYFPQCRINPTAGAVDLNGSGLIMSPGHYWMHPGPTHAAVVRWQSTLNATVRVWGSVADSPVACGNGVMWHLDKGAVDLISGDLGDMGPAQPFDLTVTVAVGDFLYFIVDAKAGDYCGDNTDVALHIDVPAAYTATPTMTCTGTPTFTPTGTPSATQTLSTSPSPSSTQTPSPTPSATGTPTPTPNATLTSIALSWTPTPAYARNALGLSVVAGPVPTKRGQPLCLYFAAPPGSSKAELYSVAGERVVAASFGAQGSPCLSTQGLAPGIYLLRLNVDGQDRWQKVAILP